MKLLSLAIVLASAFALLPYAGRAEAPRTLVYRFDIAGGLVPDADPNGGQSGEITVVVGPPAAGGGEVVDVTESVDRDARPLRSQHCTIYGATTAMKCDADEDAPGEELSLLEFLGPTFFDPSRLDAKRHWHTSTVVDRVTYESDFTVARADGGLATMSIHTVGRLGKGLLHDTEDGTLIYDTAAGVPRSVRLRGSASENGRAWGWGLTLDLVSDSLAKPPNPNPH